MCNVFNGYTSTSEIEHGLSVSKVDNPLAKARGLSLRTGAQTMVYHSLFPRSAYTKKHHFLALQTPLAETDIYKVRSFPQTISDWNSLADFLISVAECA